MKMRQFIVAALVFCLALSLSVPAPALDEAMPDPGAAETGTVEQIESPGPPASEEPDEPEVPAESEEPVEPEEPAESEESAESEEPVSSEEPDEPAEPDEPDESDEPTEPEEAAESIQPAGAHTGDGTDPAAVLEDTDSLIDVVVPSSGEIVINPYHLEVGEEADTAQIIHQPQALLNRSPFAVSVNVRAVGTVPEGSGAVLVSEVPAEGEKEVFLYVEFQNSPEGWEDSYTGASNQIIAAADWNCGENVLTLDAWGEGYFRVSGAMSEESSWTNDDTFGAVLVFTFSAATVEEPDKAEAFETLAEPDDFADADSDELSPYTVPD